MAKVSNIVFSIIRILLGISWLQQGLFKFQAHFDIFGLVNSIHQTSNGIPAWYQAFVVHVVGHLVPVFNILIPFGEVCVGLGLIFGVFTKGALVGAVFMNTNYWLSNMIYIYPIQMLTAILVIVFFKYANHYRVFKLITKFKPKRNHELMM